MDKEEQAKLKKLYKANSKGAQNHVDRWKKKKASEREYFEVTCEQMAQTVCEDGILYDICSICGKKLGKANWDLKEG